MTLALGWTWPARTAAPSVLALLFPDGHLPSPRWRPLVPFAVVWLALSAVLSVFVPGSLEEPLAATINPVGNDALYVAFGVVALTGLVVMLVAAIASLVVRFRRDREQREQIKWVLAAVVLVVVFFLGSEIAGLVAGGAGLPDAVYLAVSGHDSGRDGDRDPQIPPVRDRPARQPCGGLRSRHSRAGGALLRDRAGAPADLRQGSPAATTSPSRAQRSRSPPSSGPARAPHPGLRRPALLPEPLRRRENPRRLQRAAARRGRPRHARQRISAQSCCETMQPAHVSLWIRRPETEP